MRLIDANRLEDDCNLYNAWDAQIVKEWLKDQPTVEAIPISWLRSKADSWNAELKTACPEDAESIRHIQQKYLGIIEEWRKEHETY